MTLTNRIRKFFGYQYLAEELKTTIEIEKPLENSASKSIPVARVSEPPSGSNNIIGAGLNLNFIDAGFQREYIPLIRAMIKEVPDLSQAFSNLIRLANTSHEIIFNSSVPSELQDKARKHLESVRKGWTPNTGGINGMVQKIFAQLMTSGAISCEWVPKNNLSGIRYFKLVDPENIYFRYDTKLEEFIPYQKIFNTFMRPNSDELGFRKLNTLTYQYIALNGDQETPNGYPPYLAAIKPVVRQGKMTDDIDELLGIMGLLGFLSVKIQRPDSIALESDKAFQARCDSYLDDAKKRIAGGVKSGVVVGFLDEAEFDFNSTTKDLNSIGALYDSNEQQLISGAGSDPSLLGRSYGAAQTAITIVFQKLLAEIQSIQELVARTLEYGYDFELKLAGIKIESPQVKFSASTILDSLKVEQAREIKIRNLGSMYWLGIISLDEAANQLGYDIADEDIPRIPPPGTPTDSSTPGDTAKKKSDRQKSKDASDRSTRRKNTPPDKKEAN